MYRPVIAITMGDAAGVGPEIIMKALAHGPLYATCRPLVVGDADRLRRAGEIARVGLGVEAVADPNAAAFVSGRVDCLDLGLIPSDLPFGRISGLAGDAAYRYVARAVVLVKEGRADAICTAPLNKEALQAGGHRFPGHTEVLAHLTGTPEVSMMLVAPRLRVIHVTTHVGLLDAIERIEPGLVERTIARGHRVLTQMGVADPRIGVCGINPHAGEGGLFGREDALVLRPAIDALVAEGLDVSGPLPADTVFVRAARGEFEAVVAAYHDQGLVPVKLLAFGRAVNVTLGLPFVRTSVDHGTAFDIAGAGTADAGSLLEAMKLAAALSC